MTAKLLKTSVENGIYGIRLDNASSRNALSVDMLQQLSAELAGADKDSQARVIVLSAEGKVFCAGHDLKEMTAARKEKDRGRKFFERTMALCSRVMQQIVSHRLPVIADVRGVATAAGCQLVASCDLAVASEDSKFATPGVHIGLFCSTPMVALSRNVGRKHAMEMLLTGEMATAEKAAQIGLVNRVVSEGQMDAEIRRLTEAIVTKSAVTLKIGKRAFYEQLDMPLGEAYEHCSRVMVENMLTRDAEEGIDAFIEKRKPKWQDA